MYSTRLTLLSGKGKITNAIVDVLPESLNLQQIYISEENFNTSIELNQKLLSKTDIIILNLSEMISNSEALLTQIKSFTPVPIIVLHLYQQKTFVDAFLNMGASAYLPINFNPSILLSTIERLLQKPQNTTN